MPKLDPYPLSPWSPQSLYGGHVGCQSPSQATTSTCWGKAVESFRNRKSGSITRESVFGLSDQKSEVVCYDDVMNSNPCYRRELDSVFYPGHRLAGCGSPGRESHYTSTTSLSMASTFLRKWGSSCFHSRGESSSSIVQKPLGRRESAGTSTNFNETKKKLDGLASTKDEKPEKETAGAEQMAMATATMNFKQVKPKEEQKFKWGNKYRPRALGDFICHRDKAAMLQSLVRNGQSQHFIFEGAPGVGKRTMARALLREVFGPDILETREAPKDFKLEGGPVSSIQINVKMSSCHIEVNLSRLQKRQAANVVMELIMEYSSAVANKSRAIILCGAEKLTEGAQLHIRNHLETYRGRFKVYFCYAGTSMLQNLKSLCTVVQIPTPSKEEIVEVLEFIAEREAIELPPKLAETIAEKAKRNVRQAVRSLEATSQLNYPFREDQEPVTGWEEELAEIAKNLIEDQTPKQWFVIKKKIENLMVHNAPPAIIFETFIGELKKLLDDELQLIINTLCQDAGYLINFQNLSYGNAKPSREIEEFVAKFMSAYRNISANKTEVDNKGLWCL